jgi:preprotein translocase SecE subunit
VARDRQRSKQRQAERRARRLEQQGVEGPPDLGGPAVDPDVAAGAPPQDEGRSDGVIEDEARLADLAPPADDAAPPASDDEAPPASEDEALGEIEDWEVAEDFAEDDLVDDGAPTGAGEAGYAVKGRRGRAAHEAHKDRPRVVQFLIAVWAELQRVQWPNRQALVTLTGVVLGFVLIAGGYLGLLDAIFSELIQAIL